MKIAVIGPYPPPYGGVSTSVKQLRHHLLREHYDARVFVTSREQASEREGIYYHKGLRSLRISQNFLYLVKRFQPDLMNSNSNRWPAINAIVVARLLRIPLVHTIYGENAPKAFAELPYFKKQLVKWSFRQIDRVIAFSGDLARFVMSLGVPEEKTVIIPLWLPLVENEISKPTLLNSLQQSASGREVVIVSTGFYEKAYGFDLIPPVALTLKERSVDFRWLIVGHGTEQEKQHIRSAISDLGLQNQVILVGELDHRQVMNLLRCSHVYVRTKYSDSFGLAIAEAHQMGCHCLYADNNPYFQEGKRLTKYRVGDVDSLTGKLLETIGRIDTTAPRDTESPFAEEAHANYQRIRNLFLQIASPHKL